MQWRLLAGSRNRESKSPLEKASHERKTWESGWREVQGGGVEDGEKEEESRRWRRLSVLCRWRGSGKIEKRVKEVVSV